jgi:hypothetical protein
VEPPFDSNAFAPPTRVTSLEPIEWKFGPEAEPEPPLHQRDVPLWVVLVTTAVGLLGVRAYYRRRRRLART